MKTTSKKHEKPKKFTDLGIKALPAEKMAYRKFERCSDPGFFIKVNPSGNKYFYLAYRFDGRERFFKLGAYREKTHALRQARAECRKARALLDQNIDPQQARAEAIEAERLAELERLRVAAIDRGMGTVNTLFEKYLAHLVAEGKRSANQARRVWLADIKPVIGSMKAKDVSPRDVKRVLFPIIQRDAMIMANRCRSYLLSAFRFGIEWEYDAKNYDTSTVFNIQSNPVRDVPRPQKVERPGERWLKANEIRDLWYKWQDPALISLAAGSVLRLILATGGQRVEEVLRASWDEFNEPEMLWEIPASRTKSGRPHVVPLTDLALETLKDAKKLSGEEGLLFPLRGDSSQFMRTHSLGTAVGRFCQRVECEKFTARDLRRTVKTQMGKMGISKEIRDRLQNHALTDVSSKHYDRYDYQREKRTVMDSWEVELRSIIEGAKAQPNVHKLRA